MINLLWINIIVVLTHISGFWENLDSYINNRHKPYHLPYIFRCALCQCWWLSLLYIIIAGPFNLMTIAICLINAYLTEVTLPLITVVKEWLLKIISWIMPR